jgi:hypothetical protein
MDNLTDIYMEICVDMLGYPWISWISMDIHSDIDEDKEWI